MPDLTMMFDPLALFAVIAGSFIIATLQMGRAVLPAALAALGSLLSARVEEDRNFARSAIDAADRIAVSEGLPRIERLRAGPRFLNDALGRLSDCRDAVGYARWLDRALTDRTERHARIAAFWDAVADTAPAMGMAGTIIGLIRMFASMSDPAAMGPAMGLALMTTLYGLLLANAIAGPIARRLADASMRELAWQREMAVRLTAIAAREAKPQPHPRQDAQPITHGHPRHRSAAA